MTEIIHKLSFLKIINFFSVKVTAKEMRRQAWKEILQKTYLISDCYPNIQSHLKILQYKNK
jgi:hypothetical protein